MTSAPPPSRLSLTQVLVFGAMIVTVSMGIRHGFGLWLQPLTMERGWTRETFAFALATQNLVWGLAGPVAGMLADRYGAFRVLIGASLLYAAGLVTMALATCPPASREADSNSSLLLNSGKRGRRMMMSVAFWPMPATSTMGISACIGAPL